MSIAVLEVPVEECEYVLSEKERQAVAAAAAKLITEDEEPVDNPFSEKQQRLLIQPLYSSWTPPAFSPDTPPRRFWAAANVGIFGSVHQKGIAPDVFVSLDVDAPEQWRENKAYFFWEYGKWPEVVIEIVSNRKGRELAFKRMRYAQMGIPYYVVFDPDRYLRGEVLEVFSLQNGDYQPMAEPFFARIGLGVRLWRGVFEHKEDTFLRWCDHAGNLLPTADEHRLEAEERAEQAMERAEQAEERASLLAAKLRELGIDPATL